MKRLVVTLVILTFGICAFAELEDVGDSNIHVDQIANSIRTLQPAHSVERSKSIARWFLEAAEPYDFDPKLLVAISFRESALMHKTIGKSKSEIGLMQVHGAAAKLRPDDCSLESPRCQILTGTEWLAFAKRTCGESIWDYVFAYGKGRCPRSPDESRGHYSTRNARRHYIRIGGTQWE